MRVSGPIVFAAVLLSTLPARAQTPVTYTLTIEPVPNGYVTARGIDCGAGRTDCQETFLPSDVVELQAVPLEGYYFLGWKGNVCIGGARATVAMSYNRSCTALFAANPASGLPESHNYSDVVFLESELVGIGPPLPPGTKNRQVYMPDEGGPGPTFVSPNALSFVVYSSPGEWRIGFRAEPGGTLAVGSYDFISPDWAGHGQLAFTGPWASPAAISTCRRASLPGVALTVCRPRDPVASSTPLNCNDLQPTSKSSATPRSASSGRFAPTPREPHWSPSTAPTPSIVCWSIPRSADR